MDAIAAATAHAEADFARTRARLDDLIRIPSCSFAGFDQAQVDRSAQATAAWLRESGFPEVRVIRHPADNALPYVLAHNRRAGPQAPTVLLYAHHDVQPPLRREVWISDPFTPTERDGRLYGRGSADDKAGIAVHAAAAAAWTAVAGRPPVNLVALIEGEEEIGSPNMASFLAAHRAEIQADCAIIADLGNVDTGLPSLTTSLRGLVAVEVTLSALRSPLHSGIWGGTVPDPAFALCALLATLRRADGNLAVEGLDAPLPASADERAAWRAIPYDRARFAEQAGLLNPALAPVDGPACFDALWRQPALSINAIQSGRRGETGNVVMDAAWARLGIRLAPGMDPGRTRAALEEHLRKNAPAGLRLELAWKSQGSAWTTDTGHPVFALMRRALERGYGRTPVLMGCGASIPFVGAMSAALGGAPALLIGVEDPQCGAHSENESLHLGDLRRAILAETAFFGLLAQAGRTA